jgi:magnesium chelatase subunit D
VTETAAKAHPAWSDACLALRLFAADPAGLGGIALHARSGPVRDRFLAQLPAPTCRLPAELTDEALFGGLDLAASLASGRPLHSQGLLAVSRGAILLAPMAERMSPATASRLAGALDRGDAAGLVLLDEGIDDEHPPAALLDRLAFHIDLETLSHRDATADTPGHAAAAGTLAGVALADDLLAALCGTALALGIASPRAALLAARAARASAFVHGRADASTEDATIAARLVLSPRATILPAETQDEPANQPEPAPETSQSGAERNAEDANDGPAESALIVLQAARAAIPAGLLAEAQGAPARARPSNAGASGQRRRGSLHGRPAGIRPGRLAAGLRLNLVETLRAAAPWQRLRAPHQTGAFPLHIRQEDFRVVRTIQRARSTIIFLVDASGSNALNRLAEAKGAVELLLAECYTRRDEVAVIAFRGQSTQALLPPTRSLVRAKRCLATLPGGGGTPLAAAIDAGTTLALTVSRSGATPSIVLLTDGRANVTRAGTGGRRQAAEQALHSARRLRATRMTALLIDTSPRPAAEASALAAAMGARYLPLPYADATGLSRAIRAQT